MNTTSRTITGIVMIFLGFVLGLFIFSKKINFTKTIIYSNFYIIFNE